MLSALEHPLRSELESELALTLRVAVLAAAGYGRAEIAERTGATGAEVRQALVRLRRVRFEG